MEEYSKLASVPQGGSNAKSDAEHNQDVQKTNSSSEKKVKVQIVGGAVAGAAGVYGFAQACIALGERLADQPKEKRNTTLAIIGGGALLAIGTALAFFAGKKAIENKVANAASKRDGDLYAAKRKADSEYERAKAETEVWTFTEKRKAIRDIKLAEEQTNVSQIEDIDPDEEFFNSNDERDWIAAFRQEHQLPNEQPNVLRQILKGCPDGYEEPMILHLLQSLGAICFSRVRAQYIDKPHAPSLQVIIEGYTGQGKGKFDDVFKALFSRVIQESADKIRMADDMRGQEEQPHFIIQTAGSGISEARLLDILADNQNVHFDMFDSEISAVLRQIKKTGGLSYENLRKAFSNEDTYRNNRSKGGRNGIFTAFFNFTFTGTPQEVDKFISKEMESGTANRICWSAIPKNGKYPALLTLPSEKELDAIRDQIDKWRATYCFTQNENGEDVACQITNIDLTYVRTELQKWIEDQWDVAKANMNRDQAQIRTRIAAIAFHCAIVLHMLYGAPSAHQPEVRAKVVQYTLYLAEYCMARFLKKFRKAKTNSVQNVEPAPCVPVCNANTSADAAQPKEDEETIQGLPVNLVAQMAAEYIPNVRGTQSIARDYQIFNSKGDPDRTRVGRAIDEWNQRHSKK